MDDKVSKYHYDRIVGALQSALIVEALMLKSGTQDQYTVRKVIRELVNEGPRS
jgi:hypothetical protein